MPPAENLGSQPDNLSLYKFLHLEYPSLQKSLHSTQAKQEGAKEKNRFLLFIANIYILLDLEQFMLRDKGRYWCQVDLRSFGSDTY